MFGSWTIVEVLPPTKEHPHTMLRARCTCGTVAVQQSGYFVRDGRGMCKSCGIVALKDRDHGHLARRDARAQRRAAAISKPLPEAVALPRETEPLPFSIGDEVRARGVRGVVTQTRVDAVLVRGIAGWIQVDEVEDAE